MMGAGNASSSLYKSNPNINTFGGSKKQGIASRVGIDAWANYGYQTSANGIGRNKLFIMNQIGGVGAGRSMCCCAWLHTMLCRSECHQPKPLL